MKRFAHKGLRRRAVTIHKRNVRAIVEAAGGTIAEIVQCTIYVSDITHWTEVDGIYGAFFAEVPVLPARAVVPVKEMHYGAQIEIQAVAFLRRVA